MHHIPPQSSLRMRFLLKVLAFHPWLVKFTLYSFILYLIYNKLVTPYNVRRNCEVSISRFFFWLANAIFFGSAYFSFCRSENEIVLASCRKEIVDATASHSSDSVLVFS